jgi:adenine-specific DNA glycosylase
MIGRKTRAEQWRDEMLNPMSPATPPPPSFDEAMKAVAAFVNSPEAVKRELAKLADRISAAEKAEAAAKAEQQTLADQQRKYEADYAAATAKHHADLDKRDAASLARDDSRAKALEAREAAVHQHEVEAEGLFAKAKRMHDAVKAQVEAFDRAATVRV